MRIYRTQKQTYTLRNAHRIASHYSNHFLKKNPRPIRTSGILFAGLAASAGISSIAYALYRPSTPQPARIHTTVQSSNSSATPPKTDTSFTADSGQDQPVSNPEDPQPGSQQSSPISGEATINNETIPLTQGTVERSFVDSNGAEHTVTITLDGSTDTTIHSNDTSTSLRVESHSSSSSTQNQTRGSPE